MANRSQSGSTTALIAVSLLVIILVAVGFFVVARIIGGGRELQQATDAGAINVARSALFNPGVTPTTSAFPDLTSLVDSQTKQINLATYNRAVGELFLVALNAREDGNTGAENTSVSNLTTEVNTLGQQLSTQLTTPANFKTPFNDVTSNTFLFMLSGKNAANFVTEDASYEAAGNGSNVFVNQNNPFLKSGDLAGITVPRPGDPNNVFLQGYTALSIGGQSLALAIPMRPRQPPHLVSNNNFVQLQKTPPDANVPPNAFRVTASSVETTSGKTAQVTSAAVIGSVQNDANVEFPASIPQGFLVFDNGTTLGNSGSLGFGDTPTTITSSTVTVSSVVTTSGGASDLFQGLFMYPNTQFVAPNGLIFSSSAGCIQQIMNINAAFAPGVPPFNAYTGPPNDFTTCVDDGLFLTVAGSTTEEYNLLANVAHTGAPAPCDSTNLTSGPCGTMLSQILAAFGGSFSVTTTKTTFTSPIGLIAAEVAKQEIINLRDSLSTTSSTPNLTVPADFSITTGLATWPYQNQPSVGNQVQFSNPNDNLTNLLKQAGIPASNSTFGSVSIDEIATRIEEINPNVDGHSILNGITSLPPGTVGFLAFDHTGNAVFLTGPDTSTSLVFDSNGDPKLGTTSTGVSAATAFLKADGSTTNLSNVTDMYQGRTGAVDTAGDGGFSHPFEIVPGGINAIDSVTYTRSTGAASGAPGLLGAFKLQEQALTAASGSSTSQTTITLGGPC